MMTERRDETDETVLKYIDDDVIDVHSTANYFKANYNFSKYRVLLKFLQIVHENSSNL